MTVFPAIDLASGLRTRLPLSVGPNIHYLFSADDRLRLYQPWSADQSRRIRILCTGATQSCPERERLVGALEQVCRAHPNLLFSHQPALTVVDSQQLAVWGMDRHRPALAQYLDWLGEADFCLCLPGTSWTHRPFESLVKGVIPILDATNARLHDIQWRDGQNCLLVPALWEAAPWIEQINRAATMSEDDVKNMRTRIGAMRGEELDYRAYARRFVQRLGLAL
jgi:hypothetical protein